LVMVLKLLMNCIWLSPSYKKTRGRKSLRWLDLFSYFGKQLTHKMFITYLPSCWVHISNLYELQKIMWGAKKQFVLLLNMILKKWFHFLWLVLIDSILLPKHVQ
jgi:hypothetical protein